MNKDIRIRFESKAEIKWTFSGGKYDYNGRKVNLYHWNTIVFTLSGNDIKVDFIGSRKGDRKTGYIRNYRDKTACDTLVKYGNYHGRHFYDGLLTVYKDLGLPLGFTKPLLREVR